PIGGQLRDRRACLGAIDAHVEPLVEDISGGARRRHLQSQDCGGGQLKFETAGHTPDGAGGGRGGQVASIAVPTGPSKLNLSPRHASLYRLRSARGNASDSSAAGA